MSAIAVSVTESVVGVTVAEDHAINVTVADEAVSVSVEMGITDHGNLTGLADNDHPQYQLTSGLGTAAFLDVGTGSSQVVQLTADSKLPAVDGSLLTNLPGGGGGGVTDHGALTGLFDDDHPQYLLAADLPSTILGGGFSDVAVPVSDDDGKVLTYNHGTLTAIWTTPSGGGGTPGGSATHVQTNDGAGGFAGDSGFVYAGSGVATLTGRLVVPVIRPASDSTTAFKIQSAAGTGTYFQVDTTNGRVYTGDTTMYFANVGGNRSFNAASFAMNVTNVFTLACTTGSAKLTLSAGTEIAITAPLLSLPNFIWTLDSDNVKRNQHARNVGHIHPQYKIVGADTYATYNYGIAGGDVLVYGGADSWGNGDGNVILAYTGSAERGKVFIGQNSGTALLDIAASTTTRASMRFRSGAFPTGASRKDGDIGYVTGARLMMYRGSTEEIFATGVQATGGVATAGGTYTATEQAMLQAVYDAARTFGMLS